MIQLKKLPLRLKRLKKIYRIIVNELKNEKITFFDDDPKWYIDMLVDNPSRVLGNLKKLGIQGRRFYRPLHQQTFFAQKQYSEKSFKNSNYLYDHGIWLPSTTNLSNMEITRIIDSVKIALRS